ncbi:hypothetical protein AB0J86_05035 [Micromonospora sp. NPDC049559]|uniref:hypothetical protein n=1 Tax=Micromonospora sp. NPDC049559 TaxID=3155923 RepID=UPI0034325F39
MARTWQVTAAVGGLGRAVDQAAAAAGDTVVAAVRNPESVGDPVAADRGRVDPMRWDVADTPAIERRWARTASTPSAPTRTVSRRAGHLGTHRPGHPYSTMMETR